MWNDRNRLSLLHRCFPRLWRQSLPILITYDEHLYMSDFARLTVFSRFSFNGNAFGHDQHLAFPLTAASSFQRLLLFVFVHFGGKETLIKFNYIPQAVSGISFAHGLADFMEHRPNRIISGMT